MPDNKLYYGDNLVVLREHVRDQSVDLVYLDPPFYSRRDSNALFAENHQHLQIVARGRIAIQDYADRLEGVGTTLPSCLTRRELIDCLPGTHVRCYELIEFAPESEQLPHR